MRQRSPWWLLLEVAVALVLAAGTGIASAFITLALHGR
jgi:hypothetical protein